MSRPRLSACLALVLLGGLAGCGDQPLRPPSLTTPAAPGPFHTISLPRAGVRLRVPSNWSRLGVSAPLAGLFVSGSATVALWRYPAATAGASVGAGGLDVQLRRLIASSRRADPGLRVIAAGTGRLDGAGAVILDVIARVGSALRRIRSEHVFLADGAEFVLETYAPPALFTRLDRQVFSPVRHSLTLLAPASTATTATTVTTAPSVVTTSTATTSTAASPTTVTAP